MKNIHTQKKPLTKKKNKKKKSKNKKLVEGEENVLLWKLPLQVPHSTLLILQETEKGKVS